MASASQWASSLLSWYQSLLTQDDPYLVESSGHEMLLGACPCQPAILAVLMRLRALQEKEDRTEPPQSLRAPQKANWRQERPYVIMGWTSAEGSAAPRRPCQLPSSVSLLLRGLSGSLAHHCLAIATQCVLALQVSWRQHSAASHHPWTLRTSVPSQNFNFLTCAWGSSYQGCLLPRAVPKIH